MKHGGVAFLVSIMLMCRNPDWDGLLISFVSGKLNLDICNQARLKSANLGSILD
jgi:hypothetical protein